MNEAEQRIGETYDCTVDWAAGPEGHLINITSPATVRIPDGEEASYIELRNTEDDRLFWVFPIIGRPAKGYELVLSTKALIEQGL